MKTTLIILAVLLFVLMGGVLFVAPKFMASSSGGDGREGRPGGTTEADTEGGGGGGWFGWGGGSDTGGGRAVRFHQAEMGQLIETIKAPGEIEPRTKVEISAEVSAKVESLPYEEGDRVNKGDMVVKLDDTDLAAALAAQTARRDGEQYRLQSEQARLEGVLSNYELAKRELNRKQELFNTGDIAERELDQAADRVADISASVEAAKFSISVIEASMASANADIDRAKDALEKTTIIAPMDGVITALNAEVGEVVLVGTMNNPGTVIMTIADLSRMQLIARVSEHDVAKVEEGQSAAIHLLAYEDEVLRGTVTHIALQRSGAADGTGFFPTEIEIDLQGRTLRSGLAANVDVEIATHEGVIVPFQSVVERLVEDLPAEIRRDNDLIDYNKRVMTAVYLVEDGEVVVKPIIQGPADDFNRLILSGLEPGDIVVAGPYKALDGGNALKHGDAVRDELAGDDDQSGEDA